MRLEVPGISCGLRIDEVLEALGGRDAAEISRAAAIDIADADDVCREEAPGDADQPTAVWRIFLAMSTSVLTAAQDWSKATFSSPLSSISTMRSMPPAPITTGTPT